MKLAKAELRNTMLARREAIAPAERAEYARRIADVGLPVCLSDSPVVVSSYWAIGAELDPGPMEQRLLAAGHRICLPAIQGKTQPMKFHLWASGDPTRERKWGIREPLPSAPEVDPDIMLVPMLAFDERGWRLGYGGGYYDRTIEALKRRKPVVLVGFAYDEQRVDVVPHLDYDQRLDWVLTPSGAFRCLSA